jgi:hypothetical protein
MSFSCTLQCMTTQSYWLVACIPKTVYYQLPVSSNSCMNMKNEQRNYYSFTTNIWTQQFYNYQGKEHKPAKLQKVSWSLKLLKMIHISSWLIQERYYITTTLCIIHRSVTKKEHRKGTYVFYFPPWITVGFLMSPWDARRIETVSVYIKTLITVFFFTKNFTDSYNIMG